MLAAEIKPTQRIRVTQNIRTRTGDWKSSVEGRVLSCGPEPTGSWFAHGKNDRFWLHRVRLLKDDGEIVDLVLSKETVITPR